MKRIKRWVCIIELEKDQETPDGFDSPPRTAAMEAIEKVGIEIKDCWSGWGCDQKHFDDIMEVWNKS